MQKIMKIIFSFIPLLAPIPAAWVVYRAAVIYLEWPVPVAGVAALTVEGLGFVSVNLAQRMYTFNHTLRMDERAMKVIAPTWQAAAVTVLYLIVTISMIALLDVFTELTHYIPAVFPLLGITGAALWAIYQEQESREQLLAEYRQKKEKERKQRKQEKQLADASTDKLQEQVAPARSKLARKMSKQGGKLQEQGRKQPVQDEALLAYWRDKPLASDRQVAEQFGTSRQAIQQRREKLIRQGAIQMTDKGVESIGISVNFVRAEEPHS